MGGKVAAIDPCPTPSLSRFPSLSHALAGGASTGSSWAEGECARAGRRGFPLYAALPHELHAPAVSAALLASRLFFSSLPAPSLTPLTVSHPRFSVKLHMWGYPVLLIFRCEFECKWELNEDFFVN